MSEIKLTYRNQCATINILGGGIKEYYIEKNGKRQDIIYGYSKDEEKSGSMGDVLFPFPGRVEDSKYSFDGHDYELSGLRIKDGHAIHGFAKWVEWEIIAQSENFVTLRFEMKKEDYVEKGFPFSLELIIEYSLGEDGLVCKAKVKNIGEEKAPFGLGFHPYFSVNGAKVDEMSLQIPAKKMVEFATNLKPTGKFPDPSGDLDFRTSKEIGSTVIDNCFTDLNYEDGKAKTILSTGDGKITIWQDQNLPYLQLYSADTIGEEHRRGGLAIEAQTCTGFALNCPEMGLRVLEPEEEYKVSWGVQSDFS